jgi:hypothetical protein
MPSPEAASRVVGRLFRADGDHITDLKIPLSTRPVDVVLWYSRVFQYKGTEASGQPVYFEASPMPYRRPDDAPLRRVDRNLASYLRPAPLDRSGFIFRKRPKG